MVAAYQRWPFAFCMDYYVFVAAQIRQFCNRKQNKSLYKKTGKILCPGGNKYIISPSLPHADIAAFAGDYSLSDIHN